jgi:hypothetical protein
LAIIDEVAMAKKADPKKRSGRKPVTKKKPRMPRVTNAKSGPGLDAPDLVNEYLRQYGYLPGAGAAVFAPDAAAAPALTAAPVPADQDLSRALRHFQALHGLPVTGSADWATEAVMRLPRCGVPDVPAPGAPLAITGGKWPMLDLRFSILHVAGAPLPEDEVRQAINFALSLWSMVTPLNFQEDDDNPNIAVSFEPINHGDGAPFGPLELAHAFPPTDGRLHLNLAKNWAFTPADFVADRFDLVSVAAHELGHTLGLPHSPSRDDLMFATYLAAHPFLGQGDLDAIRSLYGPR